MQFSDTTNNQGLVQNTYWLLFRTHTSNDYVIAAVTRHMNIWYRRVQSWIFDSQGAWAWEDTNQTDLPYFRTNLTTGQDDYSLPTDYGAIDRAEIKDVGGNWTILIERKRSQIQTAIEQLYTANGIPTYIEYFSNSYRLYPASDRTSSDGDSLRIYTTRMFDDFTVSDTTQEPGFHEMFHPVLSYGASYEWAVATTQTSKANAYLLEINKYQQEIMKHYARRNVSSQSNPRITPRMFNAR